MRVNLKTSTKKRKSEIIQKIQILEQASKLSEIKAKTILNIYLVENIFEHITESLKDLHNELYDLDNQ
jgi:hypothetical protein